MSEFSVPEFNAANSYMSETSWHPRHPITQPDAFDITFTRRDCDLQNRILTPRQSEIKGQIELPVLTTYPLPPNAEITDSAEERKRKLLETYQEFVLDLHTGMFLRQLTTNTYYCDIHCQLSEDMETLKLAMNCGNIIEFSLTGVSKVHRVVKNGVKWYNAHSVVPGRRGDVEHIVIVEFVRRKLAFAFTELQVAQRFLLCMELLTRSVQQRHQSKVPTSVKDKSLSDLKHAQKKAQAGESTFRHSF
jgi:hypothetical protein